MGVSNGEFNICYFIVTKATMECRQQVICVVRFCI